MRVADVHECRDGVAVKTAQCVDLAAPRKCPRSAEFLGVRVDERVTRPHENVSVGHILQVRPKFVMTLRKRDALAAISDAVDVQIDAGPLDVVPVVGQAVVRQIAVERRNKLKSSASRLPPTWPDSRC